MDVPSVIPVFALPNTVLFPGVPLPLHIFEVPYREMIRDVSAAHGIIGMSLLRGDWQKDHYGHPAVFETGCAGRIVNVEALPDEKFNVLLHGFREFTIRRHLFEKSYRQAEVAWRAAARGTIETASRGKLSRLLTRFLETAPDMSAHKLLHDASLSDDLLVNFFSYALPVAPLEKQSLLEAETLDARAQRLCDTLEFHLEERRSGGGIRGGSERCH